MTPKELLVLGDDQFIDRNLKLYTTGAMSDLIDETMRDGVLVPDVIQKNTIASGPGSQLVESYEVIPNVFGSNEEHVAALYELLFDFMYVRLTWMLQSHKYATTIPQLLSLQKRMIKIITEDPQLRAFCASGASGKLNVSEMLDEIVTVLHEMHEKVAGDSAISISQILISYNYSVIDKILKSGVDKELLKSEVDAYEREKARQYEVLAYFTEMAKPYSPFFVELRSMLSASSINGQSLVLDEEQRQREAAGVFKAERIQGGRKSSRALFASEKQKGLPRTSTAGDVIYKDRVIFEVSLGQAQESMLRPKRGYVIRTFNREIVSAVARICKAQIEEKHVNTSESDDPKWKEDMRIAERLSFENKETCLEFVRNFYEKPGRLNQDTRRLKAWLEAIEEAERTESEQKEEPVAQSVDVVHGREDDTQHDTGKEPSKKKNRKKKKRPKKSRQLQKRPEAQQENAEEESEGESEAEEERQDVSEQAAVPETSVEESQIPASAEAGEGQQRVGMEASQEAKSEDSAAPSHGATGKKGKAEQQHVFVRGAKIDLGNAVTRWLPSKYERYLEFVLQEGKYNMEKMERGRQVHDIAEILDLVTSMESAYVTVRELEKLDENYNQKRMVIYVGAELEILNENGSVQRGDVGFVEMATLAQPVEEQIRDAEGLYHIRTGYPVWHLKFVDGGDPAMIRTNKRFGTAKNDGGWAKVSNWVTRNHLCGRPCYKYTDEHGNAVYEYYDGGNENSPTRRLRLYKKHNLNSKKANLAINIIVEKRKELDEERAYMAEVAERLDGKVTESHLTKNKPT